jgi:hypothetical protein
MFKLYLLAFTTFCCFCNAHVEYQIIPLDSAGATYDLSMMRPPLGPNAKGQFVSSEFFYEFKLDNGQPCEFLLMPIN